MGSPTDEELLVAVGAGPGALPEFYRRHVGRVMGFGTRRFDTPEDVADFTAAVFLEVLATAHTFDPKRGGAVSWLYGVAGNVAAGQRRRAARQLEAERALNARRLLEPDDYNRIEERLDASARVRSAHHEISRLPEAERRVAELVLVDELSPGEAAAALGISAVSARVRLSRARRRLRNALQHPTARNETTLSTTTRPTTVRRAAS